MAIMTKHQTMVFCFRVQVHSLFDQLDTTKLLEKQALHSGILRSTTVPVLGCSIYVAMKIALIP
jgi:hypothetical protein